MTQEDKNYLLWRCKTSWHNKYHRYINEWINNVIPNQGETIEELQEFMRKEAYCSFEVSKILKKKGFDEECIGAYSETNHMIIKFEPNVKNSEVGPLMYFAPTHQMAMKWLREVHNIFIEISTSIDLNGKYHYSYTILDKECKYIKRGYTDFDWNYEEACEAAIKYCLENLI